MHKVKENICILNKTRYEEIMNIVSSLISYDLISAVYDLGINLKGRGQIC